MANFGHITKKAPDAARGGYKNELLLVKKSDVSTYGTPLTTTALGDKFTISTAHTFPANKGYYSWSGKLKSVLGKGASQGDPGMKQVQYTYEGIVIGDDASTQEQMSNSLNEDLLWFFKDSNCLVTDAYVQLGDECDSPEVDVEFDSQNSDGTKNWKVTVKITGKRFFYNAALVKAV